MERDPEIPFTYQYSQPHEYHFSVDSIEMPWKVSKYLLSNVYQKPLGDWKCLDLCSGCGVIGFELNFHIDQLHTWDFVEIQEIYQSHFERNRQMVLERKQSLRSEGQFQFLNLNYEQIPEKTEFQQKYQLIVCNPPYFLPQQGKLSSSEFKNRCRFFLDSSFDMLIESLFQSLAMDGEAFLLLRDLEDHQINLLAELRRILGGRLKCENLDFVRGTFLLRLYHERKAD